MEWRINGLMACLFGLGAVVLAGCWTSSLTIDDNDSLTSLDWLENFNGGGGFTLSNNDALTDTSALDEVRGTGTIEIVNNDAIEVLDGFADMESTGNIFISDNDVLTDLRGLGAVTSIFGLYIADNALLADLPQIENLTELDMAEITGNPSLSYCAVCDAVASSIDAGIPITCEENLEDDCWRETGFTHRTPTRPLSPAPFRRAG